MALTPGTPRPLIVAHAANSVQTGEAAVALGADMIEFDVRRTDDHVLVLRHDAFIDGRSLPPLAGLFAAVGGKVQLDIELKEPGLERDVLDALDHHRIPEADVLVTSFEPRVLETITHLRPSIRTGLLVCDMTWAQAVARFTRLGAHVLGPHEVMLDDGALEDAAQRGIALMPWTVNDPARMERLLGASPVVALITDHPAEALDQRARLISSGARPHTPRRAD